MALHLHADNPPTCDSCQTRGNDGLHYMCMALTCWPLQALAEARTLVGCWHSEAMTTEVFRSTSPPPRTLAKSSNVRGCVGPGRRNINYTSTFTFSFTFTFTLTFTFTITSTICLKFTSTFTETLGPRQLHDSKLHSCLHSGDQRPGIEGRHKAHIPRGHCPRQARCGVTCHSLASPSASPVQGTALHAEKPTVWLVGGFIVGASCVLCHFGPGCT